MRIEPVGDRSAARPVVVLVAARDEAGRIAETLGALSAALPGAHLLVADDGSRDGTAAVARAAGAAVLCCGRRGKGQAMSAAAQQALREIPDAASGTFLLCDGDLGRSAGSLVALLGPLAADQAQMAVASFAVSAGGGVGAALGFSRWAVRRGGGPSMRAPMSGQRALTGACLQRVIPFADGYGMEVAMSIDAARAGQRIVEVELDLSHRITGRTPAGFAHRGRQLADVARACARRR